MEKILTDSATLAALPPAPRRVRLRGGWKAAAGLWFSRLFTLPHVLVGIGAAGMLIYMIACALLSSRATGTLTNARIEGRGNSTDYVVRYTYRANGRAFIDSQTVSKTTYDALMATPEGTPGPEMTIKPRPVTIDHLDLGPVHHSSVESNHAWVGVLFLLIWAGFWNTCMVFVVRQIWVTPLRQRWLIRHGAASEGRITGIEPGKNMHRARFAIKVTAAGELINGSCWCEGGPACANAKSGDAVTVVYSVRNPRHAVALELCMYEVREGCNRRPS